jgi:hypothetical protein
VINVNEVAWLAGLLEGEGSFHFASQPNGWNDKLTLQLVMTDRDVVLRAYEVFRMGNWNGPYPLKSGKDAWHWSVSSKKELPQILMTIYPLMGKRRQRQIRQILAKWRDIPYSKCRRGHNKFGRAECSTCKILMQQRRRSRV